MNENLITTSIAIAILPLAAFVIQIFVGKRLPRQGDWVSTSAIGLAFLLSLYIFFQFFMNLEPGARLTNSFEWLNTGELLGKSFVVRMGVLLDNVTAIMLVVVTLVSLIVHLYSIGYMRGDPKYSRYFGYLSFFSFAMLALVIVDNLFALYMCWELVGLGSYLLIGFWYEKRAASAAAIKAFVVNRVGDVGMFVGIMTVVLVVGAVGYDDIFRAVAAGKFTGELWGIPLLTVAGVGLFMGAVGKSAQFPLHVWLPDAMEGPTPVSALIHAATMVAAGVYLVTRLFPMFNADTLLVIAYVGGFTALFAASIALVQNDIKKVLAYSTVSQLGYMLLALGVGAYTAGIMHLVTHAAFKACLFLCSGSVIHALHTQDMREMGGLRKKMPYTFVVCLTATLAISGIPFFSGFISKDMILAGALDFSMHHGSHWILPFFGFTAAAITAFYMFRLIFMTFLGEPNDQGKWDHAHESPMIMLAPKMVLAGLSLGVWYGGSLFGFHVVNLFGKFNGWFEHLFQKPVLVAGTSPGGSVLQYAATHVSHAAHQWTLILSIFVAVAGILMAWLFYGRRIFNPEAVKERMKVPYRVLANLYYVDAFYNRVIVANLVRFNNFLFNFDYQVIDQKVVDGVGRVTVKVGHVSGEFDNVVIDNSVDGIGTGLSVAGLKVRKLQTGRVQQYIMIGMTVIILMVLGFIWKN